MSNEPDPRAHREGMSVRNPADWHVKAVQQAKWVNGEEVGKGGGALA